MLGALVSKEHMAKVKGYVELARSEGCTVLCGDGVDELSLPEPNKNVRYMYMYSCTLVYMYMYSFVYTYHQDLYILILITTSLTNNFRKVLTFQITCTCTFEERGWSLSFVHVNNHYR